MLPFNWNIISIVTDSFTHILFDEPKIRMAFHDIVFPTISLNKLHYALSSCTVLKINRVPD